MRQDLTRCRRKARLVAACLALACSADPALASGGPSLATIVVDGAFDEWQLVLANPVNVTLDDDGSTLACAQSQDADCPVSRPEYDLRRLAWTWDASALSFYIERQGGARMVEVPLYLDIDRDGLMQGSDRLVMLTLNDPGLGLNDTRIRTYVPAAPGGDPLVSSDGRADGFVMAGSVSGSGIRIANAAAGSPDTRAFEARLPWSALGLSPFDVLDFHVALYPSGQTFPAGIEDNLGGPDGRVGTTAFDLLVMEGDQTAVAPPGSTVRVARRVRNDGSTAPRVDALLRSSCGLDMDIWLDLDGNGRDDVYLGHDVRGDGRFDGPGDDLGPSGDSNGDGRLDLGILAPGANVHLAWLQVMPDDPACRVARTQVQLTSSTVPDAVLAAEDSVFVGILALTPDRVARPAVAGDHAWFPHVARNGTPAPVALLASCASAFAWECSIFADPNADGDPADAAPTFDGVLGPAESRALFARLSVPPTAARGIVDDVLVRLEANGDVAAFALDEATVQDLLLLRPHHLFVTRDARYGPEGSSLWFPHRLTNGGSTPLGVRLSAVSDAGWPVSLHEDPDGDGRPFDALAMASPDVVAGAGGAAFDLLVRVDVPPGAAGTNTRVTLAGAPLAGGPAVEAFDDAAGTFVGVFSDADRRVNLSETLPCTTVHAVASGLDPGAGALRFTWRDASGISVRLSPASVAGNGTALDALSLPVGGTGDGWSVTLEEDTGLGWRLIDTAPFNVRDPAVLRLADVPGVVHRRATLAFTLRVDNPGLGDEVSGLTVRWRILDPSGLLVLDSDTSAFVPYTGTEWSGSTVVPTVRRESSEVMSIFVPDVAFPSDGTHAVEAWRDYGCGADGPPVTAAFEVLDDEDGDGLAAADESATGTDPLDADTDDDGRLDGAEGTGDADGDGVPDALECDADGDGLLDGTEVGVSVAGPDTSLAAGCFQPDRDPTTTTDPTSSDTDGGGRSDGAEDANADGRRDVGESDPLDPADDFAACDPTAPPEVSGLRVARAGTGAELRWDPLALDACTTYTVLAGPGPRTLSVLIDSLASAGHVDASASGVPLRFYLVRADSDLSGPGR